MLVNSNTSSNTSTIYLYPPLPAAASRRFDDAQEIIRDADTNNDNVLDEEEFSQLLKTVLQAR